MPSKARLERNRIKKEEDKYIKELMMECHQLLSDVGIPVADIKKIKIYIEREKRMHALGTCSNYNNEHYKIAMNKHILDIREKYETEIKITVLHELVHTCSDADGHGEKFVEYAKIIKENTGYDILSVNDGFQFLDKPLLMRFTCPNCGCITEYHNPRRLQSQQGQLISSEDVEVLCPYCHSVFEREIFVHQKV